MATPKQQPLQAEVVAMKKPPSALASFVKTMESNVSVARPSDKTLTLGALKPLGSQHETATKLSEIGSEPTSDRGTSLQLKEISSTRKPPSVSALAAFAATTGARQEAVPLTFSADLPALGKVNAPKKPAPLTQLKAVNRKQEESQHEQDEEEIVSSSRSEMKMESGRGHTKASSTSIKQDKTVTKPEAKNISATEVPMEDEKPTDDLSSRHHAEMSDEEKAGEIDESEDSMAEFACMESSDDDEGDGGDDDDQVKNGQIRTAHIVDDLYDQRPREQKDKHELRPDQRIFVPQRSKEELFHAILSNDVALLTNILSHTTPSDVLEIRDVDQRTMYHYAALSKNTSVQAVVFQFISCFFDQEIEIYAEDIESKQRRLESWRTADKRAVSTACTWVPPSVKQLSVSTMQKMNEAYLAAIHSHDRHGRSFFHYSAAMNRHTSPLLMSKPLQKAVRSSRDATTGRDLFGRSPLEYAVLLGNTKAVELWFKQLRVGDALVSADIDRLIECTRSSFMQRLLYRLLEESDTKQFTFTTHSEGEKPLGLGIEFLSKLPGGAALGESKPSTTSPGSKMWSLLHKAAIYGNADAVETFIEQDGDVNVRDADGWTPLHQHCASQGSSAHASTAEHLVSHRADVNARSVHGRTPLHITAMQSSFAKNHEKLSIKMLQCSLHGEQDGHGATAVAKILCDHGAKLDLYDEDHCTPFLLAVKTGNIPVAFFLLRVNCDSMAVDKNGGCALHIAAARGHEEMVRFLSWWDAETPVWRLHKDFQRRLPRALAKNECSRLAMDNLWYGARWGDVEQTRSQLQASKQPIGSDARIHLDVRDETPMTRRTALHLACLFLGVPQIEGYCSSDHHELLLSKQSQSKFTASKPLKKGHESAQSIVAMLLHSGASLSARDQWGITPLMLAACLDTPVIIKSMLQDATPKDVALQDIAGNTALHYSYAFCRAHISSLLEELMDDTDVENNDAKLPLAVTDHRHKLFPAAYQDFLSQRHSSSSHSSSTTANKRK